MRYHTMVRSEGVKQIQRGSAGRKGGGGLRFELVREMAKYKQIRPFPLYLGTSPRRLVVTIRITSPETIH